MRFVELKLENRTHYVVAEHVSCVQSVGDDKARVLLVGGNEVTVDGNVKEIASQIQKSWSS